MGARVSGQRGHRRLLEQKSSGQPGLLNLPPETQEMVLWLLTVPELGRLAATCRQLHGVVDSFVRRRCEGPAI